MAGEIEAPLNQGVILDAEAKDKNGVVSEKSIHSSDNAAGTPAEGIKDAQGFQGNDEEEYVNGHPVIRNGER